MPLEFAFIAGTVILALGLAYGVARTRARTEDEIALTEQATKDLYKRRS
ncbi:hypothetical protein PB2503_01212 [Parvularcula bermudensis HTCC2503]|uniref:Uncharacterized protein n=1 Tax=Parvularcula bermudensis (strain ATCC BAA-594 / HTCC2503 / KCTC 12087) TaxID=314260 RepID=E0TBB8_PARBH|nr:hypothetical protein [Parvularcula bermudensis]ADM08322.1 hypothetical protein PB2503_01212 [Parvularcula bermudensis HTCC2503]